MNSLSGRRVFAAVVFGAVCASLLPACGEELNPFYLGAPASSSRSDVVDGGEDDATFPPDGDHPDRFVSDLGDDAVDGFVPSDAFDVSSAADVVDVANDADQADVADTATNPDVVVSPDALDASAPDAVETGTFVDVVPGMDVVDVVMMMADTPDVVVVPDVVTVDRPDVVTPVDRPDVVMVPDIVDVPASMPDIVDVPAIIDVPPPPPEFVLEYISQNGGDIVPENGNVSMLSLAFEGDNWRWQSLPAQRFTRDGSSNWFRASLQTLTPAQRGSMRVMLSIVGGCGVGAPSTCPVNWAYQWRVIWSGMAYTAPMSIGMENRETCRAFGDFTQGCVRFTRP